MFYDYDLPKDLNSKPTIEICSMQSQTDAKESNSKRTYTLKNNPTEEDYKSIAGLIGDIFKDGFQWHDISDIMKLAWQYVSGSFSLSDLEKKTAVIKIIDYLIDITDVPYLPDFFVDPIFKAIASSFVDIAMPDKTQILIPSQKAEGSFDASVVDNFINQIKNDFADGFQWHDIASVTSQTIAFVHQFIDANLEEKTKTANDIIDKIIDNTNIPLIPDEFADPILKSIANGFIDNILSEIDALI